jgi:transposase
VIERAQAVLDAGGTVWMGDETTVRELPPLRCAWAKRGEQAIVVISGRNARRVIHGAINVQTGELVHIVRERSRQDDCIAFVTALGQQDPGVPKLLIWDNAPPHHPTRVLQAAAAVGVEIAWLPFRAPELNPCEDLWRVLKGTIAGNRVFANVADLAAAASRWLSALTTAQVRRSSSLTSHKFQWLPT